MKPQWLHGLANTWIGQVLNHMVGAFEMRVLRYYSPEELVRLIRLVRHEDGRFLFRPSELAVVHSLAGACRAIPGDYAEVGVFRGTSAKIISEAKGDKNLFLFDTFEGLPLPGKEDERFTAHQFAESFLAVKNRLQAYENVFITPGIFPASGAHLRNHHFAFVHLDVDLYTSTRESLEFFYPRMNPGGIILSHDYAQAEGVRHAFDEFFASRPERVVRLPMSQCMVVCGMEMSLELSRRIEGLLEAMLRRLALPNGNDGQAVALGDPRPEWRRDNATDPAGSMVLHVNAPEDEWDRVREMAHILNTGVEPDRVILVIHREGDLYDPGSPPIETVSLPEIPEKH